MTKASNATVFAFLFSTILHAQTFLSPSEAVSISLQNNYTILISRNDQEIAERNQSLGNAGFLPRMNSNAARNTVVTNTKQIRNQVEQNFSNAQTVSSSANIALNWTLFDGLGMFMNYERLKGLNEVARLNLRENIQQTVLNVQVGYFNVVLQKEILKAIQENIKLSEERLRIINVKVEVGSASKYEALQAQVDVNTYKAANFNQQNILDNAKVQLNNLLSREVTTPFEVADSIPLETINPTQLNLSLNNTIMIAQKNQYIARKLIGLARSFYAPVIGLSSGYNFLRSEAPLGLSLTTYTRSYGYTYGINASWNLFGGFNQRRLVQVAKINNATSTLVAQQVKLQAESNFVQFTNNYNKSLQQLALEDENIKVASLNAELALERLDLGMASSLDVKIAQQSYLDSKVRRFSATYNVKVAELQLLKVSGRIVSQ